MLKKIVKIIIISFFVGNFAHSEIVEKGLICKLSGKPRVSNYSDIIVNTRNYIRMILNFVPITPWFISIYLFGLLNEII